MKFWFWTFNVAQVHWLAVKLGISDGLHDFLHGFCPCQVDLEES